MKPTTLLRLYPRAWRERYGEEFLAIVSETRPDWGVTMDVAKSAWTEWLDHPNLRGGRELLRLAFGFVCGVAGLLTIVGAIQAGFMAGMRMNYVTIEVLATARGLFGPVTRIWAIAMMLSTIVALLVVRLKLHESKPRLASLLVKYLVLAGTVALVVTTSPPFARISPFSLAMVIELLLNVYCAGIVVQWAMLGPRQRRLAVA